MTEVKATANFLNINSHISITAGSIVIVQVFSTRLTIAFGIHLQLSANSVARE